MKREFSSRAWRLTAETLPLFFLLSGRTAAPPGNTRPVALSDELTNQQSNKETPVHKSPSSEHRPLMHYPPMSARPCQSDDRPTAFSHSLTSRPPSEPSGMNSPVQKLPTEMLQKIFSYLPLSSHGQCALVERRWYACLPSLRKKLTLWLEQHPCLVQHSQFRLAPGYSNRTAPWLRQQHCELLPQLHCQHQEWLQQQERLQRGIFRRREDLQVAQQQAQTLENFLSGLLRYSLHQQILQAQTLDLYPALVSWPGNERVVSFAFSPCSRWLATSVLFAGDELNRPGFLRLHGWQEGSWKAQTLLSALPAAAEPVTMLHFTSTPQDRLLSAHGTAVLVWQREAETGNWHCLTLCHTLRAYTIYNIFAMPCGDVITLSHKLDGDRPGFLMLISPCHDAGWAPPIPFFDTRVPHASSFARWACRLALSAVGSQSQSRTSAVLVWHKSRNGCGQNRWNCQTTVIEMHNTWLQQTSFSPDGNFLLSLLSDGRVCLWTLNARCGLLPGPLMLLCSPAVGSVLSSLTAFQSEGRLLAVACSPQLVKILRQDTKGGWTTESCMERPSLPEDRLAADDRLRTILLSSSGQLLVWLSFWRLEVWQRDSGNHWHRVMQRRRHETVPVLPEACFLAHGDTLCTMAADPVQSLWLHGLNSAGQLVRKAAITVTAILAGTSASSPDGLSLMLGSLGSPPTLLQLGSPTPPAPRHQDGQPTARE